MPLKGNRRLKRRLFKWELAVQVPCLLRCETHTVSVISGVLCGSHRKGACFVYANIPGGSTFLRHCRHFLAERRHYRRIVEPMAAAGTSSPDVAITVPSKTGKSGALKMIEEIKHRFFGFGIFCFFVGYLRRRCLHEL